jgi:transcriptional regulator with XRE-family HTH domain
MNIGDNIKKWRELRNLKQSELAELLGVSDKTISSWEINRTEPKMGMVEKISSALNCRKTDIIGIDDETEPDDHYYLNDETRQIAQEAFENPELRTLFKVARDIPPERLKAHIEFMKSLKAQERGDNDEGC